MLSKEAPSGETGRLKKRVARRAQKLKEGLKVREPGPGGRGWAVKVVVAE